jgi:heme/copper-type cytochrome/quinol oxidase subunit 2
VAAATVDRVVRVANSTTMRRRLILSVGLLALAGAAVVAQDQAPNRRDFALIARDHQFTPNRIEVTKDDLVRITLTSEDRPYSFAIDAYHILKRVGAGKTIVFDFRADQAGAFAFYCNLTSDPGCRDMRGTLVVTPK